eukprot:TRINITY_DN19287_c1_g1_i1.p1 TRINITY_DN19287_c1_g1~~TRINITY_DN19287_c1_g1_i1.p1  ORF type:complete len:341 (-),score=14.82 TRINITY_DN19287_c1_g1_i1:176-1198(-)
MQFSTIQEYIKSTPTNFLISDSNQRAKLEDVLTSYVQCNSKSNVVTDVAEIQTIIGCLKLPDVKLYSCLVLLLLKVLKILCRNDKNRRYVSDEAIRTMILWMTHRGKNSVDDEIATESANVLLNLCYQRENVNRCIKCQGLPLLLECLKDESNNRHKLRRSAAGAIQSICFQKKGRVAIRSINGIRCLVQLIQSSDEVLQMRALGAIHNLSADPASLKILRNLEIIPTSIYMLKNKEDHEALISVVGILQNISREVASRSIIREKRAMNPLLNLIRMGDIRLSGSVVGALLNIVCIESQQTRDQYSELLSLYIALNVIIKQCVSPLLGKDVLLLNRKIQL